MQKLLRYFTKAELALWGIFVALILVAFLAFDRSNYMLKIVKPRKRFRIHFGAKPLFCFMGDYSPLRWQASQQKR